MIDTGDATVDALISGLLFDTAKSDKSEFTYTFALGDDLITDPEYDALNEASIQRHLAVFAEVAALTGLTFREVTPVELPDFYFAFREAVPTAYVVDYLGGTLHVYNPLRDDPILGSYTDHLILHEFGHGLGLEHGHGFGRLPDAFQGHSWSVMSYRAHPDTDSLFYADSHGPETYMPADIAALQYLYGANYATAAGDTTYTVDFGTGEFFIDDVGQGVPINQETLRTIWDGDGNDTLDLSNAESALRIDLQPGNFTSFGQAYLAYQGEGRFGNDLYAAGNIANAYLYEGNTASLIENALGGDFSDFVVGNVAHNVLDGGAGDDSLFGLAGDDDLSGGTGDDLIVDGIGITTATGGEGEDFIAALSSDNALYGGADGDILIGGIDDDILQGGDGNDVLRGEAGRGLLFGADRLIGGSGDDLMMGGRGADQFEFAPDEGNDVIGSFLASDLETRGAEGVFAVGADFQSGVDTIVLTGFADVTADNLNTFVTEDADSGHVVFLAEGTSITFFDVTPDGLQAEDFLFL